MDSLLENYTRMHQRTAQIEDQITAAREAISAIQTRREGDLPVRIARLEEQIRKIDEYLLKIEGFRRLAERNLESKNVLTIEAPPGYRVNLNRLRSWAMMIDPMSSNDPYAQRVYVVAKCDEHFLEGKKQDFTRRIAQLKEEADTGRDDEIRELESRIDRLNGEFRDLALSDEMAAFAAEVTAANRQYWYETPPETYVCPEVRRGAVAPGACAAPLHVPKEQRPVLKTLMGKFYDSESGRVLLPVELDTGREFAMAVTCTPSRARQLDRALQNLILKILEGYPAGRNKVYVLDAVRFNSAALGSLRQMENTFAIAQVPRNPEQLSAALERIVSSFADLDEALELCDSVSEYNETAEAGRQLPRRTIVLFGWPNAFESRDRDYLQRIMTNYERYGISFISVTYHRNTPQDAEAPPLPEYAAQNAMQVTMLPRETLIRYGEEAPRRFTWYTFSGEIPAEYAEAVRACRLEEHSIGNEYPKRYDCAKLPAYVRSYQKIELPFGIDSKDRAHSLSFENENFAAYLVGASRSGKSTLLHTLIAGLIRQYHPDNVELWLADFKQLEFKRYITHCPPHVKYILLDESQELVYDLIDKLTDKMMERQRIFARLGKERIDQIAPDALEDPMPVIFVILDEFSIMSQAIADSQAYKLKLQNLLAKGAALGIRFLFSSQTFTTGIAGLTPTARAQIQQRIAMKGTKEEISETLELSPNLKTEQVRNWMDALPPHYGLVKYRVSADTLPQVMRVLVMYFPDYSVRDQMIESLNRTMVPVETYQPGDIHTYVNKHPVLVDGNTYEAYDADRAFRERKNLLAGGGYNGDEIFLFPGTPRLMRNMREISVTPESRQNLLLLCGASEQNCGISVITSAVKAFKAQKRVVEVWAYQRNPLYRAAKEDAWKDWEIETDLNRICTSIHSLRQRLNQGESLEDRLIVLLGFESICMDFEFMEPFQKAQQASGVEQASSAAGALAAAAAGILTDGEEDEASARMRAQFSAALSARSGDQEVEEEEEEFLNLDDLDALLEQLSGQGGGEIQQIQRSAEGFAPFPAECAPELPVQKTAQVRAYNAKEDLKYIVQQGPRNGLHFLLCVSSYADFKQVGIREEAFRHRLTFRISADESRLLFGTAAASSLAEHVCLYTDTIDRYSFRPYLHPGVSWDGWSVAEDGTVISPFT